jgi:hypothetical protein
MLKKLTNRISFSLLPLFSVLFIAVGMPLFHPVLHSRSENHGIIWEHCDEHISALADEDHELNCPICDFLATRQLYDTGMAPSITRIQPIGNIISIKKVFLAKSDLSQTEPRAPPGFTSQ